MSNHRVAAIGAALFGMIVAVLLPASSIGTITAAFAIFVGMAFGASLAVGLCGK